MFKISSVGSSLLEVIQDIGWKVSIFDMTVELEQNTPIENLRKCVAYNRDSQTTEDKCTEDENCEYSTLFQECRMRMTKKVIKTYRVPNMFPGQRISVKARKTSNC